MWFQVLVDNAVRSDTARNNLGDVERSESISSLVSQCISQVFLFVPMKSSLHSYLTSDSGEAIHP